MAKETEEQMLERLAKRHPEIYKKLPKKSTPKPKPNPRNKKKSELEKILGMSEEEINKEFRKTLKSMGMLEKMDRAKELDGESRRRRRQLGEPTQKKLRNKPKSRPNQMDRNDPTGIQVKDGGLVLRVTRKGPLYKGKKSGSYS